ncbi:MAG TPA: hypothetical protein VFY90_04950 [Tepidiformaceae bacterium]|nr:hypothetical protein [Tepidiformaceae bacterium]
MGKKSTEIQYELERQRNALEARIQRLKRRIQDDVDETKSDLRSDVDRTVGRESKLAEHPNALLAGATFTGVVLGMASESIPMPRPKLSRNGKHPEHEQQRGQSAEEKRGLKALAGTAVAGSVQGQLNDLLADAWDAFRSGFKKSKVNDDSRLPPDVRSPDPRTGGGESGVPGGPAAGHGTRYLSRDEVSPDAVDADMALKRGEKSPEQILHDARVEDYSPRENLPGYSGVQGEGLLLPPTPGVQAPYEEQPRGERRTGQ